MGRWHARSVRVAAKRVSPLALAGVALLLAAALPLQAQRTQSPAVQPTARDIMVDLAAPPTAAPGGDVKLLVSVYNFEDTALRIRFRVDVEGWRVLDDGAGKEHLVEAGDVYDVEMHLEAPRDAKPGQTRVVRLLAEVPGEPGAAQASARVRITADGLKAGQKGVAGNLLVATRGVDLGAGERGTPGGSLDLAGRIGRVASVSISIRRGLALNQPPVLSSYVNEENRVSADLRGTGWTLTGGNQVYSSGSVLTGPFARGEGLTFRRTAGRFTGDATLARPVNFSGAAAGLLARASATVGSPARSFGVSFSELRRPAQKYLPGGEVLGGGVEAGLARGTAHRLFLRAGVLHLAGDTGQASTGPSAEAQYVLAARRATMNLRARSMPASLPATFLPGNELSGDASLRLLGHLRASARGYSTSNATRGQSYLWRSSGGSGGLAFVSTAGYRLDVRANYRESASSTRATQRTASAVIGVPVGPLSIDGMAEIGRAMYAGKSSRVAMYRAAARWFDPVLGSALASVGYYDYGTGSPPLLRADLRTSARIGTLEMDGGGWVSHGPSYGGNPVLWTNLVLPLPWGLGVVLGGEWVHGRAPYTRYLDPISGEPLPPEVANDPTRSLTSSIPVDVPASPFRLTLGIRRRLMLALASARPNARPDDPGETERDR